jgi:lysozyme family protein
VYAHGHYGDPAHVIAENVDGDPGGVTKWGIDKENHPDIDVVNLTLADAIKIYHDGIHGPHGFQGGEWAKIHGDALPEPWAIAMFDIAINPGLICIHWAQEIIGAHADGVIGPVTIAAITGAKPVHLRALLYKRDVYYQSRGRWADKFQEGWSDRNNALRKELGLT